MTGPLGLGLLGLVILATGCAYFNTFYLAKKYYKEGQKAQDRNTLESLSPEAGAKYDQTIVQCQKVLVDYPKSKWADDAAFLMAAAYFGKGDNSTAIRRLEEFQTQYANSPFLPEARFIKGVAHLKRREYVEADSIFEACERAYPKFPRRGELYFQAGESRAAQREFPRALEWYARALDAAKSRRGRSDALRRTGDALMASGRPDSAIQLYATALRAEERSRQRLDLALRRAEALRDLKRYDEAVTLLQQWRPNAIAEKREGELLLRLYEVEARMGRTAEALSGYRRLTETHPNTPVAYDAQFRIGYLYESAMNDFDTAAKEYEKLKKGPPSEFQTQANRRSQGLASLRKYQESLRADTTQAKARSAFMLAELYYFQLDKPDSALLQYSAVEAQFPRSVYAPKSAYARLWITALDRSDTLAAQVMTDSMAARYRGTRFAESALYFWKRWSGRQDERTALLQSILENPDTTGASRFEPEEAEADTTARATVSAPDSGYVVPPEMMNLLTARRAALLGQRGAKQPPAPPTPGNLPPRSPGDSLFAARADSLRATARGDSLRAAARADSLRAAAAAAARDTTGGTAPADSSKTIFITPSR